MNEVFRKLQFKNEDPIRIVGAPAEFRSHLEEMRDLTRVVTSASGRKNVGFALVFVRNCADIDEQAPQAVAALEDDGVLWFAYPKKSSKRYSSDIGRDAGSQVLGDLGFEGVRQVAIDEDWSALRFRRADRIKTMRRDSSRAMSKAGKKRTFRK